MPNVINENGLQVNTSNQIITNLSTGFETIYGADINILQNSPDGQMINIFAQANTDLLELLVQANNTFSFYNAYGVLLDQRVALLGIERNNGTYTYTNVLITASAPITLKGLNSLITDPTTKVFTVADDTGNEFYLNETYAFTGAGTSSLLFRAKEIGQVETIINTITNQVTVIPTITNVNNPTVATIIGKNEETDQELKIRAARSFSLAATSPADAIEAALLATPNIADAYVAENNTNVLSNSIPGHSIWCIVEGGTDEEVGKVIYAKKNPGCGMKGSDSYIVVRPNGSSFTAYFDRPITQNLYIKFGLLPKISGLSFDTDLIKSKLATALVYKLGQKATIGDVVIAMIAIEPMAILTDIGVSSDGATWEDVVIPLTYQYKFVSSVGRINIL